MDSFLYSINSTIPIFLVMIIGAIIKKIGIIDDNFANKANKYVFDVALPVLLFQQIASAGIGTNFDIGFVLFCAVTTIISFCGVWLLTEFFMKDDKMKGSFVQGSFRSSAAILGLAFIQNMYSDAGQAPLMIIGAVPLYNIFSVIVLTFKANGDIPKEDRRKAGKENIRKACINILKNPIIIGILLGLPFSFLNVDFPVIVDKTLTSIASTATPIALIVIGAGFKGKQAIKKIKPTLVATFIKLVLLAAVFLPIAIKLGYRNQELMAALIMLASPATVSGYIMAKNMDNDYVLSSSIIVLTTMFSSLTLTMWIYVLRLGGFV